MGVRVGVLSVCMCTYTSAYTTACVCPTTSPTCVEILRNYESMLEVILPSLPTTAAGMSSPEGRAAFVWILGEYGDVSVGEGM